jgi:hypothetical protein
MFFRAGIQPFFVLVSDAVQVNGNHLFAVSGPLDPAKQILADFLDGCATAFSLCPLMLQKWTVR